MHLSVNVEKKEYRHESLFQIVINKTPFVLKIYFEALAFFHYFWYHINLQGMNIEKEIIDLLNYHECVIVPDFGAFISNYRPAVYNAHTGSFTPPSKDVVFNSKIQSNDGLLINHIAEKYDVSFGKAAIALGNYTTNIYRTLNKGEKVHFDHLGYIEFDRSGALIYTQTQSINLADSYGLKQFNYLPASNNSESSIFVSRPAVGRTYKHVDILKIAASITLLFALSVFPLKNDTLHIQSSNLNPFNAFTQTEKTLTTQTKQKSIETIKAPWVLIAGSFSNIENARILERSFNTKGYNAEILETDDGIFRVAFDSYFDRNEAITAMENYRSTNPESGVWVSIR